MFSVLKNIGLHGFWYEIRQHKIVQFLSFWSRAPKLYTVVGLRWQGVCNWVHVTLIIHTAGQWDHVPDHVIRCTQWRLQHDHIWVMRDHVIEQWQREPEHAPYMDLLASRVSWTGQHHHIWAWAEQHWHVSRLPTIKKPPIVNQSVSPNTVSP